MQQPPFVNEQKPGDAVPVLYDGDMGGDDIWTIAMALAHRDRFNILGISTVFGNVSQPLATRNIQNALHWLGEDSIPVVQGEDKPCDGMRPFGDDAYGSDGVGGVILPESPKSPNKVDIADWYRTQLYGQAGKTTIFATGPATNLARLVERYPQSVEKIERIIFMGGAMDTPGKNGEAVYLEDGTQRIGNITPFSEFNAYQDPRALNILIESGAPLVIMAADATQHMVLTPARQKEIIKLDPAYGPAFHRMLMAVDELDRTKFGVDGPFIHDPNVLTYALQPELYHPTVRTAGYRFHECDPRGPDGDHRGEVTLLSEQFQRSVTWIGGVSDQKKIFSLMKDSLAMTIRTAVQNQAHLVV